jgi:hypothetical protein
VLTGHAHLGGYGGWLSFDKQKVLALAVAIRLDHRARLLSTENRNDEMMQVRNWIMAAAVLGTVFGAQGVARADGGAMTPMPGGKIYTKGAMTMGKPIAFEMKIDPKTMAMLHADMMHHNKMAPTNSMMCVLHVVHQHRGIVMLACTPG